MAESDPRRLLEQAPEHPCGLFVELEALRAEIGGRLITGILGELDDAAGGMSLRGVQRGFSRVPATCGELTGLQRVEDSKHLVDVATNRQVIDAHEADHPLGVDDVGGSQANARVFVKNS